MFRLVKDNTVMIHGKNRDYLKTSRNFFRSWQCVVDHVLKRGKTALNDCGKVVERSKHRNENGASRPRVVIEAGLRPVQTLVEENMGQTLCEIG